MRGRGVYRGRPHSARSPKRLAAAEPAPELHGEKDTREKNFGENSPTSSDDDVRKEKRILSPNSKDGKEKDASIYIYQKAPRVRAWPPPVRARAPAAVSPPSRPRDKNERSGKRLLSNAPTFERRPPPFSNDLQHPRARINGPPTDLFHTDQKACSRTRKQKVARPSRVFCKSDFARKVAQDSRRTTEGVLKSQRGPHFICGKAPSFGLPPT